MGYERHHAIVVTSWSEERLTEAHRVAQGIFGDAVTAITPPAINNFRSFFIGPDGSGEGWADSDAGDERRDTFIAWIREHAYSTDGGSYLAWAEVQYGDDDFDDQATRSVGKDMKAFWAKKDRE